MSTQRKMILPGEKPSLVLLTIEAARARLPGHTEDDILALIEEGPIEWAWNIGLGESREVRIWPGSIDRLLNPKTPDAIDPVRVMLGDISFLRGHSLRLLWNCSSTHIINLVRSKLLSVIPGTTWGTGPQGSPYIAAKSIQQFLEHRRIL